MMTTPEIINIGALPNDGEGDPLRTAFRKINNNFAEIFSTGTFTYLGSTTGNTSSQVIFETDANIFTQGVFQINSYTANTPNSQNITINAAINNGANSVKFTAFAISVFGTQVVSNYDMDLSGGNVRILVNPSVNDIVEHFLSAQITFNDTVLEIGIPLELDGYVDSVLGTENDFIITTEQPA
jgi:hypothetical protein